MIAFMTDWGLSSYYVGVAKAVMKRINPRVEIIDLSHGVEHFNVRMAMHMLYRSVPDFPKDTIFLVVVDQGVGTSRKAIAIKSKSGYTFVGPDNGVFTLVADEFGIEEIRELRNEKYFYKENPSTTFHGRDIFAPVAAHLSLGADLSDLGPRLMSYATVPVKRAKIEDGYVKGEVAYFDGFGNLETNIPAEMLEEIGKTLDDDVIVEISGKKWKIPLVRAFGDVRIGELLVHEDSSGFIEIAVNQGNARHVMGIEQGSEVRMY